MLMLVLPYFESAGIGGAQSTMSGRRGDILVPHSSSLNRWEFAGKKTAAPGQPLLLPGLRRPPARGGNFSSPGDATVSPTEPSASLAECHATLADSV